MNPSKLFPLIITDELERTRAYYTEQAGFSVSIEQDGYLQVRHGSDEAGPELCFLRRCDDTPLGPTQAFPGQGLIISVPTEDADRKHAELIERGAKILAAPSDKPWGWRSFLAVDPNGVVLDFFHVTAQSAVADATG